MCDVKRITRQKVRARVDLCSCRQPGPGRRTAAGQEQESFEHLISFMMAGAGGWRCGAACHWPVCDK